MGQDAIIQAIKRDIEELLTAKRAVESRIFSAADSGIITQGILEEFRGALEQAANLATVDINRIPVRSIRPTWGPFITLFKRAVRKSTYWLYQPIFQQITAFNNAIMELLNKIVLRLEETHRVTTLEIKNTLQEISSHENKLEALLTMFDEGIYKCDKIHEQLFAQLEGAKKTFDQCIVTLKEISAKLKQYDEINELFIQKIEALEKTSEQLDAKLKESLSNITDEKTNLHREIVEDKQRVQDMLRELASLRRLVDDYRAEAAFMRAKLALVLQYQHTGRWFTPKEERSGHALQPFEGLEDTSWLYHAFEQHFRGPEELIKERQRAYIPDVHKAYETCGGYVLDLGAGRGEFLELCRDAGIPARGVDLNEIMVERCQEKGLEVERADAIAYLQSLPDESLCAVTAFQLVEHLAPQAIWQLVQTSLVKLRPGGVVILETINPHSLTALQNFNLDLTHQRPIPAPTLRFLLEAAGFRRVEVRFSSPVSEELRLQGDDPNVAKLNELLFGYQDYAIVGWR